MDIAFIRMLSKKWLLCVGDEGTKHFQKKEIGIETIVNLSLNIYCYDMM